MLKSDLQHYLFQELGICLQLPGYHIAVPAILNYILVKKSEVRLFTV